MNFNQKISVSGNPFLFDEHFGISEKTQKLLQNIDETNADDFTKNYLIKTEDEWEKIHHSKRTIESCRKEFLNLKKIYSKYKKLARERVARQTR